MIPDNLNDLSELEVAELLRTLEPDEKKILKLRFGIPNSEPQTLEEVGETLGLTREEIRKAELAAMVKLGWINLLK